MKMTFEITVADAVLARNLVIAAEKVLRTVWNVRPDININEAEGFSIIKISVSDVTDERIATGILEEIIYFDGIVSGRIKPKEVISNVAKTT